MSVPMLRMSLVQPKGGAIHVARSHYRPGQACPTHYHDFSEVFWIEQGTAVHVRPTGDVKLGPGSCVFIEPEDVHGFTCDDTTAYGFTLVNIAFSTASQRFLRDYAGDDWPWPPDAGAIQLEPATLSRLADWVDRLAGSYDRLAADAFLLDLLRLARGAISDRFATLPRWLRSAIDRFRSDGCQGGVSELVRLTGYSTAHVNRILRAHAALTTTALVDDLRLDRASDLLRLSDRTVTTIALDAGYAAVPHFYRSFQRRFRCTPRAYRRRHLGLTT